VKLLREVVQIWEEKTSFSIHFSNTESNLEERQIQYMLERKQSKKSRGRESITEERRMSFEIYLFGTKEERE